MSEYQYYEFLAVDHPLDERQLAEVRALSTRATVTATRFVNEYHWGDFRGDPARLMELYYDAHLYLANWGTRRVMLRLPRSMLDVDVAEQYCLNEQVAAWISGEDLVLDLVSEDEADEFVDDAGGSLAAIAGVRAEIAAGDLRALYVAWLAGFGTWERDEHTFAPEVDEELEPPVPAGLRTRTAAQQALADFLRLDGDLLDVAARASPELEMVADDPDTLATWVASVSSAEKDRLLARVLQGHAATVRTQLLRRFHAEAGTPSASEPQRTVADLLDAAAGQRAERKRSTAARHAAK